MLLINRALARSGYLGPMPVGTSVYPTALNVPWEIIGIVDDVRQYGLDQEPDRKSSSMPGSFPWATQTRTSRFAQVKTRWGLSRISAQSRNSSIQQR